MKRTPANARRLERVVLALRTSAGVPLDLVPPGALDRARGVREGLWDLDHGRLALTARGFLRIDAVEAWLSDRLSGAPDHAPTGGRVDTSRACGLPCRHPNQEPPTGSNHS